jgi:hypothetical protein
LGKTASYTTSFYASDRANNCKRELKQFFVNVIMETYLYFGKNI